MSSILHGLYPELRRLPAQHRAAALRRARREPFDFIELIGMAAALVLVTFLARHIAGDLRGVERLGLAVALLVVVIVPFHIRRMRRGLRGERDPRGAR